MCTLYVHSFISGSFVYHKWLQGSWYFKNHGESPKSSKHRVPVAWPNGPWSTKTLEKELHLCCYNYVQQISSVRNVLWNQHIQQWKESEIIRKLLDFENNIENTFTNYNKWLCTQQTTHVKYNRNAGIAKRQNKNFVKNIQ